MPVCVVSALVLRIDFRCFVDVLGFRYCSDRCRGAVQDCLAKYRHESILLLVPLLVPILALGQERRKGHVVDD